MYRAIARNKRNTVFTILLFLAIVGGLGYLASVIYGDLTIVVVTLVIATAYALFQYFTADRQARPVDDFRPGWGDIQFGGQDRRRHCLIINVWGSPMAISALARPFVDRAGLLHYCGFTPAQDSANTSRKCLISTPSR